MTKFKKGDLAILLKSGYHQGNSVKTYIGSVGRITFTVGNYCVWMPLSEENEENGFGGIDMRTELKKL